MGGYRQRPLYRPSRMGVGELRCGLSYTGHRSVRAAAVGVLGVLLGAGTALPAKAACNLIPQTTKTFDSIVGTTNRPFAAPNELIEVGVRPCDSDSAGVSDNVSDQLVTVVFTPIGMAARDAVVLTAGSCSILSGQLATCQGDLGGGQALCVDGSTAGLRVASRPDGPHLQFLFPDTDKLVGTLGDNLTLAGPATIAVTRTTAPSLPCGLASATCSAQKSSIDGLVACIDDFVVNDGTCGASAPQGIFNHFTALPVPNDFASACTGATPPCSPTASQFRLTTDQAGNALVPMNWSGVLVRPNGVPFPRLLRASLSAPVPVTLPGQSFFASFSPDGGPLAPIFVPQFDTSSPSTELNLFGSADAPYTVLRIARRSDNFEQCHGGINDGLPCNEPDDCPALCSGGSNAGQRCTTDAACPGGTCSAPSPGTCGSTTCVGGSNAGTVCTADSSCPGGECGPAVLTLTPLVYAGTGPVVLPRQPGVCGGGGNSGAPCTNNGECPGSLCVTNGFCEAATSQACSLTNACSSTLCVDFQLTAENPVPLTSLAGQSRNVLALTADEPVDGVDRNGDGDSVDAVVTMRDSSTGTLQPLGAPAECIGRSTLSAVPPPQGRAVVQVNEPPFVFPAVAASGDLVAFLESEPAEGNCDANGNGAVADSILRVFRLRPTDYTAGVDQVADAAPVINSQSVAITNGQVFFRMSEAAAAHKTTTRANVDPNGGQATDFGVTNFALSADGRFVAFGSASAELVYDTNGIDDIFVRDRALNSTERVSVGSLPVGITGFGGNGAGWTVNHAGGDDVPSIASDVLTLTNNGFADQNSAFFNVPQNTTNLSVSFTFRAAGGGGVGLADGAAFVLQNAAVGPTAVGSSGGGLGYFLLSPSAAVELNIYTPYGAGTGYYTAGQTGAPLPPTPLCVGDCNGDGSVNNAEIATCQAIASGSLPLSDCPACDGNSDGKVTADDVLLAEFYLANGCGSAPVGGPPYIDTLPVDLTSGHPIAVTLTYNGTVLVETLVDTTNNNTFTRSYQVDIPSSVGGNTAYIGFTAGTGAGTSIQTITDFAFTTAADVESNGQSDLAVPAISADGRYVAFSSSASNLVAGDGNGKADVFVRDRVAHTTTRVSVDCAGVEGNDDSATGGPLGSTVAISGDGRFVVFPSRATNLDSIVPDTNGVTDVFLRDRCEANGVAVPGCTPCTTRMSLGADGVTQGDGDSGDVSVSGLSFLGVSISADGRYVAFASVATNLLGPGGDTNGEADVFVRDRCAVNGVPVAGCHPSLRRVSVASDGTQGSGGMVTSIGFAVAPSLSADGRYVSFVSDFDNLVPGSSGSFFETYVHDQVTGRTTRESTGLDGAEANGNSGGISSLSADGRYLTFCSEASNLVSNDTNGTTDVFLRDRVAGITSRINVTPSGGQSGGEPPVLVRPCTAAIAADGSAEAFLASASDLVPGDTNGITDQFVRGVDTTDVDSDVTGDGDFNDTVLGVLDTTQATSSVVLLCPADAVSTAGGAAAFLRPERAGATPGLPLCPAGTSVGKAVDLNGNGTGDDEVVHLALTPANVQNLGVAATAVSLAATCVGGAKVDAPCADNTDCPGGTCAPSIVAALVSEAGQAADLNGDGDTADTVVEVYPASGGTWSNVQQAADTVQVAGTLVAMITPEAAQNATDLNGDGDASDRVLQVYDVAAAQLTNLQQAAEEFVMGTQPASCGTGPLIAFRTSEAAQGHADLNNDGDATDDVLQVYIPGHGVIDTHEAVTPCGLQACDPRQPYLVQGDTVKFLTDERDQQQDLNGNGTRSDLILQIFNACTKTLTVVGAVDPVTGVVSNPLESPGPTTHSTGVLVTTAGSCVAGASTLLVPALCSSDTDCPQGAICRSGTAIVAAPAFIPPTVPCLLQVDGAAGANVATNVVYIARHLLGLAPVPARFRTMDPSILPDSVIAARVDALGSTLDVDGNGLVDVATDIVYIARRRLGLAPVPVSFRALDPGIPSDATIAAIIDALCP